METAPPEKEGRSDLPNELGFALAPRETDPTPVMTRSSEVSPISRIEPTSVMVTRSGACTGRPRNYRYSGNIIGTGNRNATGTGNTGFHVKNP